MQAHQTQAGVVRHFAFICAAFAALGSFAGADAMMASDPAGDHGPWALAAIALGIGAQIACVGIAAFAAKSFAFGVGASLACAAACVLAGLSTGSPMVWPLVVAALSGGMMSAAIVALPIAGVAMTIASAAHAGTVVVVALQSGALPGIGDVAPVYFLVLSALSAIGSSLVAAGIYVLARASQIVVSRLVHPVGAAAPGRPGPVNDSGLPILVRWDGREWKRYFGQVGATHSDVLALMAGIVEASPEKAHLYRVVLPGEPMPEPPKLVQAAA